jgi:hypothetical protein
MESIRVSESECVSTPNNNFLFSIPQSKGNAALHGQCDLRSPHLPLAGSTPSTCALESTTVAPSTALHFCVSDCKERAVQTAQALCQVGRSAWHSTADGRSGVYFSGSYLLSRVC